MALESMKSYLVSLEELVLSYSMVNSPDLGQRVLKEFYDDLTQDQVDSRMVAASHSLLAHGLCGLTEKGTPRLDPEYEKSLLPLINYEALVQMSLVQGESSVNTNIHLNKYGTFTAHSIQAGVVHLLEHSKRQDLQDYILDILEGYGKAENISATSGLKVSLGFLGEALNAILEKDRLDHLVDSLDWGESYKENFSEDLKNQISRATIIKVKVRLGKSGYEIDESDTETILLLNALSRTWCFRFLRPKDEELADVTICSRDQLEKVIRTFLS